MTHPLDFTHPELTARVRALAPAARRELAAKAAARAAAECGLRQPALAAARAGSATPEVYRAVGELLRALEAALDALDPGPIDVEIVEGRIIAPDPPPAWERAMRAAAAARAHWALLDPDGEAGALGALDQVLLSVADPERLVRALSGSSG